MHDLVIRNGKVVDGSGRDAFYADVAVRDGKIAEVGRNLGPARREIDAAGALVTPGWVDVHTHYDGQVTWDPELSPSSWHGVTTVVMGNCGVGFAPARPNERDFLIRVMEGVEEIPGSALDEGMTWDWESFPEYLDSLERQRRSIDVVAQVPHSALRCYVMGEARALEDEATPDEIAEMSRITEEALQAGALGFTTSRTILHKVKHGPVIPGTNATPEELVGIAKAFRKPGHGVFQMISDHMGRDPDFPWMKEIARTTGGPLIFSFAQRRNQPEYYKDVLQSLVDAQTREGLDIRASVAPRPAGILEGLMATLNPFLFHPSYRAIRRKPLEERAAIMRDASFKARLLEETPHVDYGGLKDFLCTFSNMFALGDPPDYEPPQSENIAARAERAGQTPESFVYDVMLQNGGQQLLYFPLSNYGGYSFDVMRDMLVHPRTHMSLSDGGAHVGTVSDANFPTYMLTYWVRDRERGERIRLEEAVRKQTRENAELYGLRDRGLIAAGKKADLNVIDFDKLHLHAPYMTDDLPMGGKRLLQRADGYRATVVSGAVIAEAGEMTAARPGKVVRGPQA